MSFSMVIPFIITSTLVGLLISKFGRYVEYAKFGAAIATGGLILVSRWDGSTSLGQEIGYYAVFGVGAGMVITPQSLVAQVSP